MNESSSVSRASLLKAGDLIAGGKYEVIRQLGEGSMGYVYTCKRKDLDDRICVIKVLRPELARDQVIGERFRDEVITALNVSHKHVVRAYDYFKDGEIVAYSMEYVDGGDLSDLMSRRDKFTIAEVINFTRQIAEGVQALHNAGIIHRDLKPENVLLTKNQEIKISDFGIAIIENNQRRTANGGLLGTASYLSPEYLTSSQIDKRSDIYAIGIIAYELLLKKHPFEAGSIYETVQNQMAANFAKPKHLRAECPAELEEFIIKSLRSDPKDRFQDCSELLKDLDRALQAHLGNTQKFEARKTEAIKLELEGSEENAFPLGADTSEKFISHSAFQTKTVVSQPVLKSVAISSPVRKPAKSSKSLIFVIIITLIILLGLVFMAKYKNKELIAVTPVDSVILPPDKQSFNFSKYTKKINKKFNTAETDTTVELEILAGKVKSFKANIVPISKEANSADIKIQAVKLQADKIIEEVEGTFTSFANADLIYTQAGENKIHKATAKLTLLVFKDTGLMTINYYSPVNLKLDTATKEIFFTVKDSLVSFYLTGRQSLNLQSEL